MAELTTQERLQPSLLDRLTDTAPEAKQEGRDQRVMPVGRLREAVLRDLAWLLNCVHLEVHEDFAAAPHARHSVINFGIPDLSGMSVSGMNTKELEDAVKQAILDFEPRIMQNSLQVSVTAHDDEMSTNAVSFVIEGDMWAQPIPLGLYLKTDLDLESGRFSISEASR